MSIRTTLSAVLFWSIFLAAHYASAQTVSLAWDPGSSAVSGYKIYYQALNPNPPFDGMEAMEGPSPFDIGSARTVSLNLPDDGRIYYFTVTAYDDWGAESPFSNVVATRPFPALLSPEAGSQNLPSSVLLEWNFQGADPATTFTVLIGTTPQLVSQLPGAASENTLWAVVGIFSVGVLGAGLPSRRKRFVQVLLVLMMGWMLVACGGDGSNGESISLPGTGLPSEPPAGDGTTSDGGDTSGDPGQSTGQVFEFSGLSDQSLVVEGLDPGTTYYWMVTAVDSLGQRADSSLGSFTTD